MRHGKVQKGHKIYEGADKQFNRLRPERPAPVGEGLIGDALKSEVVGTWTLSRTYRRSA